MTSYTWRAGALALAASLLPGCPLFAKDQAPVMYPFSEARRIAVLPLIDSRADKSASVNGDKIRKESIKILTRKRYDAVASNEGVGTMERLTEDDLKKADPEFIQKIGPANERWVLVVCLSDAATKTTLGSSANAQVLGFLFDKQRNKVAWSDTGAGHVAVRGIIGIAAKSSVKTSAVWQAISRMLEGYPKLPKQAR